MSADIPPARLHCDEGALLLVATQQLAVSEQLADIRRPLHIFQGLQKSTRPAQRQPVARQRL